MVLRLESPTRTLTLEAPRGVEVNAGVGDFTASCRKDLLLQSSEGEVSVCLHIVLGVCAHEKEETKIVVLMFKYTTSRTRDVFVLVCVWT